jgi:LuxR family maltose regulon positive regulatory protein
MLTILRLLLAQQRGDLPAVAEEADRLLAALEAPDTAQPGLGEDLRALAVKRCCGWASPTASKPLSAS